MRPESESARSQVPSTSFVVLRPIPSKCNQEEPRLGYSAACTADFDDRIPAVAGGCAITAASRPSGCRCSGIRAQALPVRLRSEGALQRARRCSRSRSALSSAGSDSARNRVSHGCRCGANISCTSGRTSRARLSRSRPYGGVTTSRVTFDRNHQRRENLPALLPVTELVADARGERLAVAGCAGERGQREFGGPA